MARSVHFTEEMAGFVCIGAPDYAAGFHNGKEAANRLKFHLRMTEPNEGKPRRRARWLALSVLARSVKPVVISGLFAQFGDRREVEAVLAQGCIDMSEHDELWVDYVADTGDGFNATATVANLLARDTLTFPVDGGESRTTQAGSLLVLGGDEVYPFASVEEYRDRLLLPFGAMLPHAEPGRTVLAIPGNHDWYDGLTGFLQVFCGKHWIGGWQTVQRRSYFACKLPQRWWLWGIDIQFDTYIDQPQLEYFRQMRTRSSPGTESSCAGPCPAGWRPPRRRHPSPMRPSTTSSAPSSPATPVSVSR